jgi:hypothetical protein
VQSVVIFEVRRIECLKNFNFGRTPWRSPLRVVWLQT